MSAKVKNSILSCFKMHGFTLKSDATRYLVEAIASVDVDHIQESLDRLVEQVQKQSLSSSMIDQETVEKAVEACNAENEQDEESTFNVIDMFKLPQFDYCNERKKFIRRKIDDTTHTTPLFGDARNKIELFRNRYTLIRQRTLRHDLFTPAAIGSNSAVTQKKFQLQPVDYLLGSSTRLGEMIVLGMLTQLKEGKWFLEDDTGAVQLDLSRANFHTGLFTESSFVLAEGWYEDEVFHANAFGFPPAEPAKTTQAFFGNINFFGGPSMTCAKASDKLLEYEKAQEDAMFVFLSDVWLDDVKVLDKLRTLFTGYAEMPPTCFVLIGSFLSKSYGFKQTKVYQDCFKTLADMIHEFPTLERQTRFVFVPSLHDIGPAHILPRPPLPKVVTTYIRERVPHCTFAANPCRIQYCTQEIVIFREDLVMKMCRNCVRFPSDGEIPEHFAKTLLSQSHLSPLPLHVEPVYWPRDHALWLYPLPDLLVCADKYDPYSVQQTECDVINPGSFPRSDWSFKAYMPATRQVEFSRIEEH